MKKSFVLFCLLGAGVSILSCGKKGSGDLPNDEEILTQKIEDIIPREYLDTLEMLGLDIYMGTHPPQMEGSYSIKPHILDTSNIPTDPPGQRFTDAIVHLSEQSSSDFSIRLLAEHYIKDADTSIATAISGYDNYFTVYGKVKSTSSGTGSYAIVALIISGIKDGDNIKDLKTGIINIDGSHADYTFIEQGQGRLSYDSDFISERITEGVSGRLIPDKPDVTNKTAGSK